MNDSTAGHKIKVCSKKRADKLTKEKFILFVCIADSEVVDTLASFEILVVRRRRIVSTSCLATLDLPSLSSNK